MSIIKKQRSTKETDIQLSLNVDGNQNANIDTGIAFFDHMLEQLVYHGRWDLELSCKGDLVVDDHHCVEDVAMCLGDAVHDAWRSKGPIQRYGQRLLPMDETLVLCAIDISGRPHAEIALNFTREFTGKVSTEMWPHFFLSFAKKAHITLHLRELASRNNHHLIEASFKALAYAFNEALQPRTDEVSTKGQL